jgi:hypothetical protein
MEEEPLNVRVLPVAADGEKQVAEHVVLASE